jgi:hypothetical protein
LVKIKNPSNKFMGDGRTDLALPLQEAKQLVQYMNLLFGGGYYIVDGRPAEGRTEGCQDQDNPHKMQPVS